MSAWGSAELPAPATGAAVIGKAMRILDTVARHETPLGLAELSRAAALPKATVHRLARALERERLLERDGEQYILGRRLFEWGQQVPRDRLYRETALPFMEDLYVATKQTVHFALLDHLEVFYVEKIMGHRGVTTPSRVAGRLPLHCTASGKAILAYAPPDLVDQVINEGLTARTPYTIRTTQDLTRQLAEVRARGVAIEREESRIGYASVAAPVFNRYDRPIGALSVTARLADADPEHWSQTVQRAATQLTSALTRVPT